MPKFDIDSYRASFGAGLRSYLFYYKPLFPTSISADSELATYLVRSTSLPDVTNDEIITNWQGFDYKIAGKLTFADWSVQFNVDINAKIEQMFHNWAALIHDPTTNIYSLPTNYMVDQQIELLGLDGNPVTKYKLYGAWPKMVGNSTLDYSANDTLQFEVTFTYVYHVMDLATYGVAPTFSG